MCEQDKRTDTYIVIKARYQNKRAKFRQGGLKTHQIYPSLTGARANPTWQSWNDERNGTMKALTVSVLMSVSLVGYMLCTKQKICRKRFAIEQLIYHHC